MAFQDASSSVMSLLVLLTIGGSIFFDPSSQHSHGAHAFLTPNSFKSVPKIPKVSPTSPRFMSAFEPSGILGDECIITPEGYGFSSTTKRVIDQVGRNGGYYRANENEQVIDVMEAITKGHDDVALVFDQKENLVGLFTEADYIRVSSWSRG